MQAGDELYYPIDRLTLKCLGEGRWEIWNADGIGHELEPVEGGEPGVAQLVAKKTRDGHHRIELHYDGRGCLSWVRDSGKRQIRFVHDDAGRLTSVKLPVPRGEGHYEHCRYAYDEQGDLVTVTDAAGSFWELEYAGHLLTRETDRERLSFYFGYDGIGQDAWCVRTWGDGGIHDHQLTYDKSSKVTCVTDSLGNTTTYRMDLIGTVVEIIDPHGASTTYEYDARSLQPTVEVDELGNVTRREYDRRGNLVRLERPDGAVTVFEYHPWLDTRVRVVDPNGQEWKWAYDDFGRMKGGANPLGHWVRYEWESGHLTSATTPGGARTQLEYDEAGNVSRMVGPNGAETRFAHDRLGRVTKVVDPCGGVEKRQYDLLGDLTETEEPHGGRQRFAYDREQNLTRAANSLYDVTLTYTGFHLVHERHEAGAVTVRYHYDTEGRLCAIENEAGELHRFERDARGLIVSEVGFDDAIRRYDRDAAGLVSRVHKPSGRKDSLEYDPCGRLARVEHSDGTSEQFRYDPGGWIVEATNDAATVSFERDELGRLVREVTRLADGTERWVRSGYGPDGHRVHVETGDGHVHHVERDPAGNVKRVELEGRRWYVDFERDPLGRELRRTFMDGVSATWQRDAVGRPTHRTVTDGERTLVQRDYQWEGDDQLRAILDPGQGDMHFRHDARGRLARTRLPWGEEQLRVRDAAGNLYASAGLDDRRYAKGGRVEEVEGTAYRHDPDGNLVERTDVLGDITRYRWNGAGMLSALELPDGTEVTYSYDVFSRRLLKRVVPHEGEAREIHWTWDRDDPLVELDSERGKTTWVFDPETCNPLAKLGEGRVWGIVTDHLGVPTELVAQDGSLAWQGTLDSYGNVTETRRETSTPFRFPGQLHNEESGLHYNRHRYYDPALGQYISEDPIGLTGGLQLHAYVDDPTRQIDPDGLEVGIDSGGFFAARHEYGRGRSSRGRVRIPYQGNRRRDFVQADEMAGFTPDNPRPAKYTWHHANYNPRTGFGDMQLVRRPVHRSRSHAGGVARFQAATGIAYETPEAVGHVQDEGRLQGKPCR